MTRSYDFPLQQLFRLVQQVSITDREREVLLLIERDPMASQAQLAEALGIARSSVAVHVRSLVQKGAIRGRGYIIEPDAQIVAIGGANVDLEGTSSEKLLMEDSNPGKIDRSPGGVARNIAEALARLGVPTRLHSALGIDDEGRWLYDQTASRGVDMSGVVWLPGASTARYLAVVDSDGELAVGINDMEILQRFDPAHLPPSMFVGARVVVVDTNLNPDALAHVFDHAGDAPTFVDPVSVTKAAKLMPYLDRIHLLKPNRAETEALTGRQVTDRVGAEAAADVLLEAGTRAVVVTLGAQGILYASVEERGFVDAVSGEAASPTGAGDALMAGLVWGYLNRCSLHESADLGGILAAKVVRGEELSLFAVSR